MNADGTRRAGSTAQWGDAESTLPELSAEADTQAGVLLAARARDLEAVRTTMAEGIGAGMVSRAPARDQDGELMLKSAKAAPLLQRAGGAP